MKTVRANKEKIVWVNVRLDRNISNNGENERFVLRQALVAALHSHSQSVGGASRTYRAGQIGRVSSRPGTGESSLMSATARAASAGKMLRPASTQTLSAQTFTERMLMVWTGIYPG